MSQEICKLLWRSRRGMLELDILFRDYLLKYGEQLSRQQLVEFESLLELQDQTLFDAYSGQCKLDNDIQQQLMGMIMARHDSILPDTSKEVDDRLS